MNDSELLRQSDEAARHTPGPWEWVGCNLESDKTAVLDLTVKCGQFCQGGYPKMEVSDADRRLIAAAPELLAALQAIAAIEDRMFGGDWDEISDARDIARAAIAKATGSAT